MASQNSENTDGKRVSLVLGSGGARGLAHIGVIKWLEENDYQVKSIAGCSIGSLVGGVYAVGKLDQLEEWMLDIDELKIASLLDLSWDGSGIFKGDKVIDALVDLIGDTQIENLPIPFTAVSVDIQSEKEVWINSGSLFKAIRASISLPLFFKPMEYNGRILIDGGVLNPVPIAPTFNDETDITIAVNLGGKLDHGISIRNEKKKPKEKEHFHKVFNKFIELFGKKEKKQELESWGMYDVADKAFDSMQSTIARLKMASYAPDVEIEIARNACGTLDFNKAEKMIELGYEKAKQALS